MPYIVTTRGQSAAAILDEGPSGMPGPVQTHALPVQSRCAVATLEEALDHAAEVVVEHGDPFDVSALPPMPESGGTIGPLPDGTVIEVAATSYAELAEARGHAPNFSRCIPASAGTGAEIIDAYNAPHA